jgi:UDP-glucose 4-epimerase
MQGVALAAHGFLPVAFDDLSRGHADFVRWGPLSNSDILDLAALNAAFERHRPGAVIHFAALPISERFVCHNGSLS